MTSFIYKYQVCLWSSVVNYLKYKKSYFLKKKDVGRLQMPRVFQIEAQKLGS